MQGRLRETITLYFLLTKLLLTNNEHGLCSNCDGKLRFLTGPLSAKIEGLYGLLLPLPYHELHCRLTGRTSFLISVSSGILYSCFQRLFFRVLSENQSVVSSQCLKTRAIPRKCGIIDGEIHSRFIHGLFN
jgi:hypothetical protein